MNQENARNDGQTTSTIDALNDLLQDELAAVGSYNRALTIIGEDLEVREDLRICRASHAERVLRLRSEILRRRGEPSTDSATAGPFANVLENPSAPIPLRAAVGALADGEEQSLRDYGDLLPKLDTIGRHFASSEIYPQQDRTHKLMSRLKNAFSSPPFRWLA